MKRPHCIRHFSEIQHSDDSSYERDPERLSIYSPLGRETGLQRIAVNHEILKPGRRTSWPHAHSLEEEFVYVVQGEPEVWIDGIVYPLKPGDGVGFPAGTGTAHVLK